MRLSRIAGVAVNNATLFFDRIYSYLIPPELEPLVGVGSMVLVPFGYRSQKARMGVVLSVEDGDAVKLKSLYDAAPESARLSPELLRLVHELHDKTFCTYYEAVKAIIPYGAQYKASSKGGSPKLEKQITRHTEPVYTRAQRPEKLTEKQAAVWDMLADGPLTQAELASRGATRSVLDTMCKHGVLTREQKDKGLSLYSSYSRDPGEITLSAAQQAAYDRLAALQTGQPAAALLHGVTSSGKTLVFIKLIERTIRMGRKALVLVPEISLTPQMIYRLKSVFGERVAVQHSALSHTERLLQWNEIQAGGADIVVGTRSAVFAPLENIGLIVIDEEQEHTYRSENSPRYSAHDIAKRRAAEHGALLVLASATPSVESYYAARMGRYTLVELKERYNAMPLPQVELVDMREELAGGNAGSISSRLAGEIERNLAAKKQTILLLNRRGYRTVGMCTGCGEVIKCGGCSVPMVYHKSENRLLCHYCGASISPVPETCPSCGERIKYTGFGTQRVEEELAERFPSARILRMDADSTSRKDSHETMLGAFARGEYDIMVGTQMVAKGLDFERVTLVGVLGVDQLLFAQGYKAFENVFSLVTQVIGRGGRADSPGRALIQTVDPAHPVLNLAARQDYTAFYEQEIRFRKLNLYPPFCRLCLVGFSGENEADVVAAASAFAGMVQTVSRTMRDVPLRVLGPAPMNITMVGGRYRYKLTLKCRADASFRTLMRRAADEYHKQGLPAKAALYLDFNSDADI